MLSSKGIAAGGGADKYYEALAKEDYYADGGEPPGRWVGKQAEALGLTGTVQKGDLTPIMNGFHPQTGEALTKRVGEAHKPGEDLTFSAPKSVSLAWANADPATQKAIADAMHAAVGKTIEKMERDGSFRTQHGRNGTEKRAYTGGLTVATYEHSTSREGDPQLHVHALVMNIGPEGRNIDFDKLSLMRNGAYFRADFADRLQQMGFTIERDKTSFRIAEIPKQLEKDFSKRRQQIEKELRERGLSGGKASQVATMATRQDKGEVNRADLFANARTASAEFGITPAAIEAMRQGEKAAIEPMPELAELANLAVGQHSTVTPQQLEAAVYQECQGKLSADQAEQLFEELKNSPDLVELRDQDGNTRYTSHEMYEIEQQISVRSAVMAGEQTHAVSEQSLREALDEKARSSTERAIATGLYSGEKLAALEAVRGMTLEQREAFTAQATDVQKIVLKDTQGLSDEQRKAFDVLTKASRLTLLEGTAGTGKSYLLDACRSAWQKDGYTVIGGALAAKAAKGLRNSSGIESRTLHSTISRIERGQIQLTNKTVFVVDEAGMAGSRLMQKLQHEIDKAGGKLVIVGDTRQLQPVDAGGAMRAQRDALERAGERFAELTEIRRQNTEAERRMVLDAKAGRGQAVVNYLQENNRIVVHETRADVLKATAKETIEYMQAGRSALAMAETKAETYTVNKEARELAKEAGMIQREEHAFSAERGERQFASGDRIYFLKNNEELGVDNGSLGTVVEAKDGALSVKLDDGGEVVSFNQEQYAHVDWGYCATVHKSQGDTVDNALYCPGSMADNELGYVALSRHRDTVKVHLTADQLKDFAKRLSTSHAKGSSSDYQRVEKHQNAIDQAADRIRSADAEIQKLEAKIETERAKLSAAQDKQLAAQINYAKELQHAKPEPDRYGRIDPEQQRAAQRAIADLRQRDAAADRPASGRQAQPIERMRDLSRINLVHEHGNEKGKERHDAKVLLQAHERNDLGNHGKSGNHELRRSGAGNREVDRGNVQAVTKSAERLGKLEKQLAEAKAERNSAAKAEDRARTKQASAWEKEKTAKAMPAKEQPKFAATMKRDPAESIKRDGELARKALEAHKAGERLPEGRKLDKAVKAGEYKAVKDSEGRTYFQNAKTGATLAKSLNPTAQRSTTSKNLNHLGATSTKYTVVDKKLLGVKVGTTVLKSGGTLKAEAAGRMRDGLREATKGNALAKAIAKPIDNALKRGERWQKAGLLESVAARIQIKVEQAKAIKEAKRELETKVKAADAIAKRERNPELAATKEGAKETRREIRKDVERGVQLPPSKAAEAAKELAAKELPEPKAAPAKEIEATPKKDAGRDFGR